MPNTLVTVDNVSKKFCRSLKRSLWYGVKDLSSELLLRSDGHNKLRKNEFWAVKNVSFELKRGVTLGLIGPNGAGKTTLLRMLNGLIKPDVGRIEIRGRMQALIALGAGFNPILTGRENIYINAAVLGIPKVEVTRRFDEIVEFSGVEEFIDTPVQNYSSGMAVRLGFAVAAHLDPDILLVDEVLAVGDHGFQKKCFNKIGELRDKGTASILVSHNMHTISTFADQTILMRNGQYEHFHNVSEAISEYRQSFGEEAGSEIQKVCSGNQFIKFYNVDIEKRVLHPGDSFLISLEYDSDMEFEEVDIDVVIYSSNQPGLYFQATNKTYDTNINLKKGKHTLQMRIEDVRINNAIGKVTITIWSKNRGSQLFWWRIPVEFKGVAYSTGSNFQNVVFKLN